MKTDHIQVEFEDFEASINFKVGYNISLNEITIAYIKYSEESDSEIQTSVIIPRDKLEAFMKLINNV